VLATVSLTEDNGDHDLPISPEEARRIIAAWDGDLAVDSVAACIYQEFRSCMLLRTLCTRLDEAKAQHYLVKGGHRVMWPLIVEHLDEPDWQWFVEGGNSRDALIAVSLRDAVLELQQRIGPNPNHWTWGRLHRPTWRHALGRIGPLGLIFNIRPRGLPGDAGTPFATAFPHRRYDALVTAVASRMVCDVGNWDKTVVVVIPGQSGHPASRNYADQYRHLLVEGDYCPFPFSEEAVRDVQRHVLTLHPAKES
jgi:penicillin amidase